MELVRLHRRAVHTVEQQQLGKLGKLTPDQAQRVSEIEEQERAGEITSEEALALLAKVCSENGSKLPDNYLSAHTAENARLAQTNRIVLRDEIDKLFNEHRAEYERAVLGGDAEWFERQANALGWDDNRTDAQIGRARFDAAVARELEYIFLKERMIVTASTPEERGEKLSAIERAEAKRQDSLSEKERAQRERNQKAWLERKESRPFTKAETAQQRKKQAEAVDRFRAQKKQTPSEPATLTPSGKRINLTAQEILARLKPCEVPNGHRTHLMVEGCRFENAERACEAIRDLARLLGFELRDARRRNP